MLTDTFTQFIRSVIPIPEEEARQIAASFEPFSFRKGEILFKGGEVSEHYLFLEKGLLRSYLYDLEGEEVTTDLYGSCSIVFDVTSFFTRTPSEAWMEALSDGQGLRLTFDRLNHLFHSKPAFREAGRAILVREFAASKRRTYAMINQSAEQRYQQLINERPEILQIAPLKYIASYLGITDSTLSRIRARS